VSGPFRLLPGPGEARFLLGELGQGAGTAVGTFARLVTRLKNVLTHVEIIAELPACHAGAVTKSRFAVSMGAVRQCSNEYLSVWHQLEVPQALANLFRGVKRGLQR
jgi:hypothetical protein